jgi:hypothetical protein
LVVDRGDELIMPINYGVERVALVGYGVLLGIGVLNLFLLSLDRPGFGLWVRAWARQYIVLAAVLAFIVGALVGHFYWATDPNCPSTKSGDSLAAAAYPKCQAVSVQSSGR